MKAIATFSGGLDSILAALWVRNLGFEVTLLHVQHLYSADEAGREHLRAMAERAGLPLRIVDSSAEHLETIRRPVHGYGAGMNPCVDCRIFMLRVARQVMEEEGAAFVISGEVLGQRPKSQHRKALLQSAEESGLGDRLLRPLSANLLPDTRPVIEGWIRREDLLSIQGRSRHEQMALAEKLGVTDYPQPAGGCVLIEKAYAARVRDAFAHLGRDNMGVDEFEMLRHGRHFRLSDRAKLIVGRDQSENDWLGAHAGDRLRVDPAVVMGPTALVEGQSDEADLRLALQLIARYCDHEGDESIQLRVVRPDGTASEVSAIPLAKDDPRIAQMRIGQ